MASVTSSPASAHGPTPFASQDGPTTSTCGPAPVPANPSPMLASVGGTTTTVTSGRCGSVSSRSAALQSSLGSRLRARMASLGSTLYVLTWKERATRSGLRISAQRASVRRKRQRLYFVAIADGVEGRLLVPSRQLRREDTQTGRSGQAGGLADTAGGGLHDWHVGETNRPAGAEERPRGVRGVVHAKGVRQERSPRSRRDEGSRPQHRSVVGDAVGQRLAGRTSEPGDDGPQLASAERTGGAAGGAVGPVGDARLEGGRRHGGSVSREEGGGARGGVVTRRDADLALAPGDNGATRGFWSTADWIPCRDGKWRPVEPGAFPLVARTTSRVGRLRAYGNAIVPQVAEVFIRSVIDILDGGAP
jgi:hypothetical protein